MTTQHDHSLTRRGFLAGAGAAAASVAAAPILGSDSASAQTTVPASSPADNPASGASSQLALSEIQGNIVGGFNKDAQAMVGLTFPNVPAAQAWLAELLPQVASSSEVISFNAAFKAAVSRTGAEATAPVATWPRGSMSPSPIPDFDSSVSRTRTFKHSLTSFGPAWSAARRLSAMPVRTPRRTGQPRFVKRFTPF